MDTKLQILELLLELMEFMPKRYIVEITSKGIMVRDMIFYTTSDREEQLPIYYSYFYTPEEDYHYVCNKQFEEFIGGLKK